MSQSIPAAGRAQNRAFWHAKIEQRSIKRLRPAKRNPRTHSKKQLEKLSAIIRQLGFVIPIIIDEHRNVVAGHLRLEVAKALGVMARRRGRDP